MTAIGAFLLRLRQEYFRIETQSMEYSRNAFALEEFHRRRKRRDDEIVATVVAVIRQRRRRVLADQQPHPGLDPLQPSAVDAVHGLVQEDVGAMVLDLRGENAAAFVVLSKPGAHQRPCVPDDRTVGLLPEPVNQPVERRSLLGWSMALNSLTQARCMGMLFT